MAVTANDAERKPQIEALSVLEGDWETEITNMSFMDDKTAKVTGTAHFNWMKEGHLLVYRSGPPGTPFPTAFAVIGFDEILQTVQMLYTDSRGVSRILTMTLTERTWRLERNAPGFDQRFEGTISDDGNTIKGYWDKRENNGDWVRDFNIRFTRKRI